MPVAGSHWWARRAPAPMTKTKQPPSCRRDSCNHAASTPFDLYCRPGFEDDGTDTIHFLPTGGNRYQLTLTLGVTTLCVAALVLASNITSSPYPLYALAAATGTVLLALPLRLFHVPVIVAVGGWLALFTLSMAWGENFFSRRDKEFITGGLIALLLLLCVADVYADHEEQSERADVYAHHEEQFERAAQRLTASLVVLAVGSYLFGLWCKMPVVSSLRSLSQTLWIAGTICLTIAMLICAARALIDSVSQTRARLPFVRPSLLRPPILAKAGDVRSPLAVTGTRVATLLTAVLYWLANRAIIAAALVAHRLRLWLLWIGAMLRTSGRLIRDEGVLVGTLITISARDWIVSTVLTALVIGASAVLSVAASKWFENYVLGGSIWDGPSSLVFAAVAAGLLTISWWSLTRWPWSTVREAAQFNSEGGGPATLVGLIAIGWIDGLAGWAGLGSMRPGIMTILGTFLVAGLTVYEVRRSRWRGSGPAPGPSSTG